MNRRRFHIPIVLACLAALLACVAAAAAAARPAKGMSANVAVGRPLLGIAADGRTSVLVPVRYPIELKGRFAELRVALIGARGQAIRSWILRERLSGGRQRSPDRRRAFSFVHGVRLSPDQSRLVRQGVTVRAEVVGTLDADGD